MSEEHRRDHRAALVMYLDVYDADSGGQLGHLGDISAHGMMFITTQAVPLNTVRRLLIDVPEMESVTPQTLHMTVETRWHQPNINPEWHCIGCRFVEIDPALLPVVEQIAKNLCFGEEVDVTRVAH